MTTHQLFRRTGDESLLSITVEQLKPVLHTSLPLKEQMASTTMGQELTRSHIRPITGCEIEALARLSLCYTSQNEDEMAIKSSLESLEMANAVGDVNASAMSQFYYGRALLHAGRQAEAVAAFNAPGSDSPLMAVCKEPSDEHRGYLQDLLNNGAGVNHVDSEGDTVLDYAVFNGNTC
jgi:hypothetical protein